MNNLLTSGTSIWASPFLRVLPFLFLQKNTIGNLAARGDYSLVAVFFLLVLTIISDFFTTEPQQLFNNYAFPHFFSELFFIGLFCYLLSKTRESRLQPSLMLSLVLEIQTWVWGIQSLTEVLVMKNFEDFKQWDYLQATCLGWEIIAVSGVLLVAFAFNYSTVKGYALCYLVIVNMPMYILNDYRNSFWYHDYESDDETGYDTYDHEKIFYGQDKLIEDALDSVAKGNPKQFDLFYMGFAGYGSQDVFKKEVTYAHQLFQDKYVDTNRGMFLVNNDKTISTHPLAIRRNIDLALSGMKKKMDDDDILFFYLTSHGSKDHKLSLEFYPFNFTDLSTGQLKESLANAGIKWKVLVISACYAGGFIEPLKDEYTIIATASDAKHTSFGCSNDNDFTYYGEALFHDQMSSGKPVIDSLQGAISIIKAREKKEGKKQSNPQLWVGEKIREHMEKFERQRNLKQG